MRLLIVDAIDMGLNPCEIRRIDPVDIAEMFMMSVQYMPLCYLVNQLNKDIGEVIFLGIQPAIMWFYYPMTEGMKGAMGAMYDSLAERNGGRVIRVILYYALKGAEN